MPIKAWVSSLQRQLVQGSRNSGLQQRRRDSRTDVTTTEHLEQRALLTALVISSENVSDFSLPNQGLTITNADVAGFDSLVIESVGFGGVDGTGIDIDLSGISLSSIAIESVTIGDYGDLGIDLDLNNVSGLETIAIEDVTIIGDGRGLEISLTGGTDVDGLTVDDSSIAGVAIIADPNSEIEHGVIMGSSLAGGIGVEGILLEMDQANADSFHIIDNTRISSQTRDAIFVDLNDAPSDGLTIHGNRIGADNPVDIDFTVDGDTFTQPFTFTNQADNGEFVTRIFIDIDPAGLEFDEDPATGLPFNPLNGTEQCSLPDNPPTDFGTCLDGAFVTDTTLDMQFTEFTPGETFIWEIDLDLAGGQERTITGADMIGTEVTFEFNDGKVISGVMVGVPGLSDAAMFSQSAGDEGANGIHIEADNSPISNLLVEQNIVSGTPGSSFVLDTFNRSDVSGTIQDNDFLSSRSDGVVFNLTDGNFAGGFLNNNVSNHDGHGVLVNPEVSRAGDVERVFEGPGGTIAIESTFHQLNTGDVIILQGLLDDDPDQIFSGNGTFEVVRLSNNTFWLNGLDGAPPPQFSDGRYDGGGQWYEPEFQADGSARGLVSFDMQNTIPEGVVQDATNTSPIVISSVAHGLSSGDLVRVSNVQGNSAANGLRTITVLDDDRFQLDSVSGNGNFSFDDGFGTWRSNVITDATNTGEIEITAPGHGLLSGDLVRIVEVDGNGAANGTHTIRRIDDDRFRLVGVSGDGAYVGGGHYLPLVQETFNGDTVFQGFHGNAITSNEGAGLQVELSVATVFNADITTNRFASNGEPGVHIETVSFGVGRSLPLDPLDPTATPEADDVSFNVNLGSSNPDDGNVIDRNVDAGVRILGLDSGTGSFEIRNNLITNTQDSGDPIFQGDGIHIRLEGGQASAEAASVLAKSVIDSNVIGVDAEGNAGRGTVFSMEERTRIQDFEFTNNSVVNNGDDGFIFTRRDDARLNNVRATRNTIENNAGDGLEFLAQNTTSDILDFRIDENAITNSLHYGVRISVLADARVQVDLENNSIDFNGRGGNGFHPDDGTGNEGASGGIGFFAFQNVQILMNMTGNNVTDNFGDGISMDAENFFDQLRVVGNWTGNTFSRNTLSGVRNNGIAFGTFTWTNNEFNDNGEDGARSISVVDGADFFDRRVGGSELSVVAIANEFRDNGDNGLQLGQGFSAVIGDGTVSGSNDFIGNGQDGLKITQGAGQFIFNAGRRRTIIADRNVYTDNGDDGIDLGHDFQTEPGNQLQGDESLTQTDIDIANSTIVNNGGDGIEYMVDPLPPVLPVVGGGQDNDAYYFTAQSSLTVRDSSIRRNLGRGIDILNRVEEDSWIDIVNNDIIANGLSGVYVVNTASRFQVQEGPGDVLDQLEDQAYAIERQDQIPLIVSTLGSQPQVEIRIEENEIESNGASDVTSTVPINASFDVGDNTAVLQPSWTHRTAQVPGTLGGVVFRVGAVDAPLGFQIANPNSELRDFAGIDASIIDNDFDGNFGTEVYFDNYTSVISPLTQAQFDCTTAFIWDGNRDAVSRFDLTFRENTGNSLDVINGFAFQDNWEPTFKSRTPFSSTPPYAGPTDNDPDGPHNDLNNEQGGRLRNQTRTIGWTIFDTWQLGQPVASWAVPPCADGTFLTDFFDFDGEGTSTWRVEPNFQDGGFSANEEFGESNFGARVDLGDSAIVGEEHYQWDTGFTPYSLQTGEVFNIASSADFIASDQFEYNGSFLAAADLGPLSGEVNVNSLTSNGALTIEAKGARDYYSFDLNAGGTLDVTMSGVDAPEALQFRVYWVDPSADVEERALSVPITVAAGQTRTASININSFTTNDSIRELSEHIAEEGSATIIVEVNGVEVSNLGGYFYGTADHYELDLDVPGSANTGSSDGGGGNSGGGGGGGGGATGGGRGSQPGAPSGFIEPVTPDPRSTGVPLVEVTFSEDVLNVDITDFELTRDGVDIDLTGRVVEQVTPSDYTLNLAGLTQEDGEYRLRLLTSDITDVENNALTSNNNDRWTVNTALTDFTDFTDSQVGDGAAEDDNGNSSLRAAVQEANAVPGADVITLPAGTYNLSIDGHFEEAALIGDLNITDDLTIIGAGAGVTIIDANEVDRLFHVYPDVNVTIRGVTLINGEAHDGGAILNEGNLEIFDSNIVSSRAFNQGGGIYNAGDLYIQDSSVVMNQAGSRGGGIFNRGTLDAVNLTVSTNTAVSRGAGLFNEADATLINATVVRNDGGARGGGIAIEDAGAELTIGNTLIAENESDYFVSGELKAQDLDSVASDENTGSSSNLTSLGNNLVGFLNDSVERVAAGYQNDDLLGGTSAEDPAIDPNLANLVQALNNGLNGTFRHNLKQGSPAIDAGDDSIYPDDAPNTDQIGQPRVLDGNTDTVRAIDIGARERFINRPVAAFTLSGNPVGVNELVTIDGSSSNHTNGDLDIVLWEWDFNFDGTTFDVDATGEVVTNRFNDSGTFVIALRVTDSSTPPQTDIETRTIVVGVAPETPRVNRPFSVTSDTTPTIAWEGGGVEFDVQVRLLNDDGSTTLIVDESGVTGNTFTIPASDRLEPGRYETRVRANNDSGSSDFSAWRRFNVKEILIRDPGANTIDGTPELRWTGVANTLNYRVEIFDDVTDELVYTRSNIPGPAADPPGPPQTVVTEALQPGRYRLRVTAFDRDGNAGDRSAPRRFNVVVPEPIEPDINPTVDSTPILEWTDVGPFYEVEVFNNAGDVVFTEQGIQTNFTETSFLPDGDYTFRVRGVLASGEAGFWSDLHPFTVDADHVLTQLSPLGDTGSRQPAFDWSDVDGLGSYELTVLTDPNGLVVLQETGLTDSEFTPARADRLARGRYTWEVRWISEDGVEGPAASQDFRVVRPIGRSPRNETLQTGLVEFVWSGPSNTVIPDAVSYELQVNSLSIPRSNVVRQQGIEDTRVTLDLPLENGDFEWRVRAELEDGTVSEWSSFQSFTVNVGNQNGVLILSPQTGDFVTNPVQFEFDKAGRDDNANTYELLINEIRATGQPTIINRVGISDQRNTGDQIVDYTLDEDLQENRTWRAWVRAIDANGDAGPWGAPVTFFTSADGVANLSDYEPEVALPSAAPALAADGTTVALLGEQITIHPALAADSLVESTTATLKSVTPEPLAKPESRTEVRAEVDSVMSEWTGNDWWSAEPTSATEEVAPVEVEDGEADAGSSEVDEKLLLAAGLPLLFGRKKKRDEKRKKRS